MKRLLTLPEFKEDSGFNKAEPLWVATQYEIYITSHKFIMFEDNVSKSMYLYGVEMSHLDSLVTSQATFVSVRMRYVEATIKRIQMVEYTLRDDDRMRACVKARGWCERLTKDLLL